MKDRKTFHGRTVLMILSLFFLMTGCSSGTTGYSHSFFAMDTYMEVEVWGEEGEEICQALEEEIERVEKKISVTDPDSDVSRLNASNGKKCSVDDELFYILRESLEIGKATDGALNISLYPLSQAWGFSSSASGYRVVPENERQEILKLSDCSQIQLNSEDRTVILPKGMAVDFGAVGKGYVTDTCADILRDNGTERALLQLGGNIYAMGTKENGKEWRVAIQDPRTEDGQNGAVLGSVSVKDKAVVTSGPYQRYFEEGGIRYHHILDPATGAPAENGLLSVTIICESGLLADGLSTGLFVMGLEKGIEYWKNQKQAEVVWMTDQGELWVTEGLQDAFQAAEGLQINWVSR